MAWSAPTPVLPGRVVADVKGLYGLVRCYTGITRYVIVIAGLWAVMAYKLVSVGLAQHLVL